MLGKITLSSVAALRPGDVLEDLDLKGFSVRCWQHTSMYSVRGRLRGQRIRINIGRHGTFTPHTARVEATRILGLLATGKDPRAEFCQGDDVCEAAEAFLTHVTARRSTGTVREYTGHLHDHLIPRFGRKPLLSVTTAHLSKLHLDLRNRPVLANRILSTASSLYGWADKEGLVPDLFNPARRVARYGEESKERFLTVDELKRLGEALRELEKSARVEPICAWRGALWPAGLRWPMDWERALLNLQRGKGGKRVVYLNAGAIAVLRKLRALPDDGNPYVIRGVKEGEPYKNLQDVWAMMRKRAKIADVRIHDLRHSVASLAGPDGVSLPLIGAVLGHKTAGATKRYLHLTGDPARGVADRVGAVIALGLHDDRKVNLTFRATTPRVNRRAVRHNDRASGGTTSFPTGVPWRQLILTWIQPGLAGLMDGSVSTLAPIFATAFATQNTWTTFLVGLWLQWGLGSRWVLRKQHMMTASCRAVAPRGNGGWPQGYDSGWGRSRAAHISSRRFGQQL